MAPAADGPWHRVARQAWRDLLPFPGRFAMAWRVALLCAIVAAIAMLYKVPESAIGCYLVIFLARPNGAECVGQAIGLILLASVVVLAMAPVIEATATDPLLRICIIALVSFVFVFLGAASQLGEIGSIIALVIAFVLTLVDQLPVGEVATRGLLYAWQMAVMPMAAMIAFYLVLGTSPHRLLRQTVIDRLTAAADTVEDPAKAERAEDLLAEGVDAAAQQVMLARLFHTAPAPEVTWLSGATRTSYLLLLAVAALPAATTAEARAALAAGCRSAAARVTGRALPLPPPLQLSEGPVRAALEGLAQPNGGTSTTPPKPPFLAPDAFSNPDYQRYALKTTAAAILCYLTYSLIGWQGIHTAMITCYVAALGTTGETVHKLALRICGCLVGAAIGLFSILFVIPHLESVGGLMVLVFFGVLAGSWVSAGSERISYAGVQVGLAFLLTVLQGFGPSVDMASARDRVVGILLGNLVVYLIFTGIWPKSAAGDARRHLAAALAALARLAGRDVPTRAEAVDDASKVESETQKAREQLLLMPFEPASQRPSPARIADLEALAGEARALLPALMFAPAVPPQVPERLAAAAKRMEGGAGAVDAQAPEGTGLLAHTARIERLAAG